MKQDCSKNNTQKLYFLSIMLIDRQLNIKATNQCNATCSFCAYSKNRIHLYLAKNRRLYQIDTEKLEKQFPLLKQKGIGILHFTGGEPFLHKGFLRLLTKAKENEFQVRTGTNGSLC